MRLIDADEILRELKNCRNELCLKCGLYTGEYLGNCDGCRYNRRNMAKWEELPTVDAEPVKHEEQEPIKPIITGHGEETEGTWWYECGNCGTPIDPDDKFCRKCGKAVKWNEDD